MTIGQWARQCLIVNTCKMQMSRVDSIRYDTSRVLARRIAICRRRRVRAPFHRAIYHYFDAYTHG